MLSSSAFTSMYAKDKAAYGDPAESSFKVSEVWEFDNWQIVLQTHMRNVKTLNFKKHKEAPSAE